MHQTLEKMTMMAAAAATPRFGRESPPRLSWLLSKPAWVELPRTRVR
jgi:hypothetical protein